MSGALATSFTVAGGGASFFLGKEARGKGRDVSKSFLIAFVLSSSAIVFSSFYLVKAGELEPQIIGSGFPGLLAARTFEGVSFEEVMFILTFNSVIGSLISAYVALSRLSFSLTGWPLSKSIG
ncbi:hypothetical protein [Metallosphaera hakonensis]|uniref:hypothetical protein n=1 Tax=Metallosphaera hakonensis TaxID=79601 RepID=UPI000A915162|nr:hypothetical protein [Metallosphaera hakonensis]